MLPSIFAVVCVAHLIAINSSTFGMINKCAHVLWSETVKKNLNVNYYKSTDKWFSIFKFKEKSL